ncbi:MAG: hypothetical protein WD296_07440 [Acidimicrobiia bacterium]
MSERTRGFVMVVCGLLVLGLNVIEAADRGATAWNIVTIATGAFLLFFGTSVVARSPR